MACNNVNRVPNINVTGEFTPVGLTEQGLFTEVTINDTTWTALPASALNNRNTVAVQNPTAFNLKINFSATAPSYEGMVVYANGGERSYPIRDDIVIYAMFEPGGSGDVYVEELA